MDKVCDNCGCKFIDKPVDVSVHGKVFIYCRECVNKVLPWGYIISENVDRNKIVRIAE